MVWCLISNWPVQDIWHSFFYSSRVTQTTLKLNVFLDAQPYLAPTHPCLSVRPSVILSNSTSVSGCSMWKCIFWKCIFRKCIFRKCIFRSCIFWKCIFWKCIFWKCIFRKLFWPKAYLAQTFSNRAYPVKCVSSELLRACLCASDAWFCCVASGFVFTLKKAQPVLCSMLITLLHDFLKIFCA